MRIWDQSIVKWLPPDEVLTLCRSLPEETGTCLYGHQHALMQEILRLERDLTQARQQAWAWRETVEQAYWRPREAAVQAARRGFHA